MPGFIANATDTIPVAGCAKVKMYSMGEITDKPVAGTVLMSRSDAFTPETASLKTTLISMSVPTVEPAGGSMFTTAGGTSSIVADRLASKSTSELAIPALKTCTASTFVPATR